MYILVLFILSDIFTNVELYLNISTPELGLRLELNYLTNQMLENKELGLQMSLLQGIREEARDDTTRAVGKTSQETL